MDIKISLVNEDYSLTPLGILTQANGGIREDFFHYKKTLYAWGLMIFSNIELRKQFELKKDSINLRLEMPKGSDQVTFGAGAYEAVFNVSMFEPKSEECEVSIGFASETTPRMFQL